MCKKKIINMWGNNTCFLFNKLTLSFFASFSIVLVSFSSSAELYFNPLAIETFDSNQAVDLDSFLTTGQQLPGKYRVELFVNQRLIDTREIDFIYKKNKLHPQLTVEQLSNLGVKVDAFPGLSEKGGKGIITDLSEYIPEAYTKFDFNEQKLYLSVPQAALKSTARGYVDPEKWDQGIPALFANYSYTSSHTYERSKTSNDYLNLQSGLNLGAWRLRNYSTFTHNKDSKHRWDNIQSYLFRDIHSLKSQLVIGDSYTAGEIFDSLKVRGISISSDNSMLPESLRGFAPVVRGIANSNAQVTIRQGGYIIYQTYVPPGAFTIDDLYPTNISGDLEVIIREANGTERRTVQPYSSVPIMVREGQVRYSVTGGKYLSSSFEKNDAKYSQATLSYGLPNAATMYSGFQVSEKYQSLLLGLGYGLGELGSLSFDLTQAKTNAEEKRYQGQSYRLKYAKNIISSSTALTLASYRYSTSGFFDFSEAHSLNSLGAFPGLRANKRSRTEISINQSLHNFGNVFLSAFQQDYWRRSGYDRSLATGYNFNLNNVKYSTGYTLSQSTGNTKDDHQFSFNIQVPLSDFLPSSWASYSMSSGSNGKTSHRAGVSGTLLQENNLNYSIYQNYITQGEGYGTDMYATYRGSYGTVNGGYSNGQGSRHVNYGLQGSIVAHPYGITFGQSLGESMALVKARGAKGIKVVNSPGVHTDWRGYAIVPYLSAYQINRIGLDTQSMGSDVDVKENITSVIPTKGSLVLANYHTRIGSRVLFKFNSRGIAVPFGATVSLSQDDDTSNTSIVGNDGEVYLSGVPETGKLIARWGRNSYQQCSANFNLNKKDDSAVKELSVACY